MELASMPVTPLARGMWRFGGLPGVDPCSFDALEAQGPVDEPVSQMKGSMACSSTTPPSKVIALTSATIAAANSLPSTTTTRASSVASGGRSDRDGLESVADDGIMRYRSRDATGRVWGMPSAGGEGQCVDCPAHAVPPSIRCVRCQLRVSHERHEILPEQELQETCQTFHNLLRQASSRTSGHGKRQEDISKRLRLLEEKLWAGKVPKSMQLQLRDAACAIRQGNPVDGGRLCSSIGKEQTLWHAHKDWLLGIKHLLSLQ
mmetsp:Transcript_39795/g.72274  ORF Transcript_39795/g.72274 Transcript_39795/m.72274 type:complete len:261 (+) Transcript_39795:106-888(+)